MDVFKSLEMPGLGAIAGLTVFVLVHLAIGRPLIPGPRRTHEVIQPAVLDMDPDSLYSSTCAPCHQAEGQGMPGQFPPLAGSQWVTEDPETPIRVVLLGMTGPIEVGGTTYNGVMPAQGQLTDEQIALLVTKIRSSWGNEASEVDAALVATVRASLEGRTDAWNGGAELTQARAQ